MGIKIQREKWMISIYSGLNSTMKVLPELHERLDTSKKVNPLQFMESSPPFTMETKNRRARATKRRILKINTKTMFLIVFRNKTIILASKIQHLKTFSPR